MIDDTGLSSISKVRIRIAPHTCGLVGAVRLPDQYAPGRQVEDRRVNFRVGECTQQRVAGWGSTAIKCPSCSKFTGYVPLHGMVLLTDGSRSWRAEATPDLTGIALGQIVCPRADTCYIAAGGGAVLKGA
jgi:hypothetical protein